MSTATELKAYDDRLDVHSDISARDVFTILKRSVKYIWPARNLFLLRFVFMLGSLIPILVAPWPLKILVDHVVLERPLTETTILFPPFITPFVNVISDLGPSDMLDVRQMFFMPIS